MLRSLVVSLTVAVGSWGCVAERHDWTLTVGNGRGGGASVIVRVVDQGTARDWFLAPEDWLLVARLDHPLDGFVVVLDARDCMITDRAEPMPKVGDVYLDVFDSDGGVPSLDWARDDGHPMFRDLAPASATCGPGDSVDGSG